MNTIQLLSAAGLAAHAGCRRWRVDYAAKIGLFRPTATIDGRPAYTLADVDRLRTYLAMSPRQRWGSAT